MMRGAPGFLLLFSAAATACSAPPAALAPGASTTPALPLDLPRAESSTGIHTVITVNLGADGRLFVDGEQIASDEVLQVRAQLASTRHADLRAVIRADRHSLYERVIEVMDRLRQAGISRIAFAVEPAAKSAGAPAVAAPTLSSPGKPARPRMGATWACPFPPEADQKGIDSAVTTVEVSVNAAGTAVGVRVLEDPGNGFGLTAMKCALEQGYTPALDARGTPYLAVTPPFHVRFTR